MTRASPSGSTAVRGQVSTSALEAAIGAVLILTVAMGFALASPTPDGREAQLDRYAGDAATLLANEPPRHEGTTRLGELVASESAFERERDALARRVERVLPANVFYRVETPHGAVGHPVPTGVATGRATVTTSGGAVTIRVWYG